MPAHGQEFPIAIHSSVDGSSWKGVDVNAGVCFAGISKALPIELLMEVIFGQRRS